MSVPYRHIAKTWMTCNLFTEWLGELDPDMERQGRHVLLLLDNCLVQHVQMSPTTATTFPAAQYPFESAAT